ncbi:uncharacterized protein LOC125315623 [Rhodamnia argentea]|uniref:Uncharacterized protein LOC125315623 n=1 Tax=Rhodamnia argentea TaxID=178133 RepID=A0ABM3HKF7_9MYRT|nr:uncharacterized protein LOC125315623 [Rhodamnia argentea]
MNMGVVMDKSNVYMIRRSWTINAVMKRLLRKWLKTNQTSRAVASAPVPAGCFPVYVGEGDRKERFVVKAEQANHPLFKSLLEDAESVYGFCCQGPLSLPCDPDFFFKVLAEMEYSHHDHCSCSDDDGDDLFPNTKTPGSNQTPKDWWFPFRITPNNSLKVRWFTSKSDDEEQRCCHASPYRLLTPPNSLLKLNQGGRPS